jgi:hypothetical protein
MAGTNSKAEKDLSALKATAATTASLIAQLQTSVKAPVESTAPKKEIKDGKDKSINVLDLCHDAASLIKAHSTKLSLLIINKPFTPTAVNTVLRELAAGPLPGLASAVELCDAARYTKVMRDEVQYRVLRVLSEFANLVREIPLDGQVLSNDQKNGTGSSTGKGSLASTGVVWDACDALIALKKLGIAGLVIQKAEQYQATLKDALEELQEWGDEEPDDDEEDEGTDSDGDDGFGGSGSNAAQDALDSMFASQKHIPRDDPEKVRERLESTLRRLKLVLLMYTAVIKRRFKTLPALPHPELPAELKAKSNEDPGITLCLDEVLSLLKKLPDDVDELANAFYELDSADIDKRMDACFFTGFAAVELLVKNWEGQSDEFSAWVCSIMIHREFSYMLQICLCREIINHMLTSFTRRPSSRWP